MGSHALHVPGEVINSWTLIRPMKRGYWYSQCKCGTKKGIQVSRATQCKKCAQAENNLNNWQKRKKLPSYWVIPGIPKRSDEITPERLELMRDVVRKMCAESGISFYEMLKPIRGNVEMATFRQACMYVLREKTVLSLKAMGRIFNRHHTSVINGIQKIQDMQDNEPAIGRIMEKLRRII